MTQGREHLFPHTAAVALLPEGFDTFRGQEAQPSKLGWQLISHSLQAREEFSSGLVIPQLSGGSNNLILQGAQQLPSSLACTLGLGGGNGFSPWHVSTFAAKLPTETACPPGCPPCARNQRMAAGLMPSVLPPLFSARSEAFCWKSGPSPRPRCRPDCPTGEPLALIDLIGPALSIARWRSKPAGL